MRPERHFGRRIFRQKPVEQRAKIGDGEHKGNSVTITPSANGLATLLEKNALLFTISTLIEAQNRGVATSRNIRLRAGDLLVYCNRGVSGAEYNGLVKAFERLAGTRIKTDIATA